MAPEQLEGASGDERTDIFAFGAVLYEMASGRRAFRGDSQASLIAAILNRDPEPLAQCPADGTARLGSAGRQMSREGSRRALAECERRGRRTALDCRRRGFPRSRREGITPAPHGPMGRDRYCIVAGCCRRRGDLAVAQRGSSRRARGAAPTSDVHRRRRDVGALPRWSHRGVRAWRLRPSSGARA